MPHNEQLSQDMRQCIENCLACHASCTETSTHCFQMGGKHAEASHIGLLLDCAQICSMCADFMLRTSRFYPDVCRICTDLCRACGDNCSRVAEGDSTMQQCADACHRCAQSWESMAGAAA